MKLKRIVALLLCAIVICIPMFASAATKVIGNIVLVYSSQMLGRWVGGVYFVRVRGDCTAINSQTGEYAYHWVNAKLMTTGGIVFAQSGKVYSTQPGSAYSPEEPSLVYFYDQCDCGVS